MKFLHTFKNLPRDWSMVNPFSSWKKRKETFFYICNTSFVSMHIKAASPCIESVESAWRCNSCSWVLFHRCWRSSELSAPEGSSRCWWRGQPPPRLTQDNWRSASVITSDPPMSAGSLMEARVLVCVALVRPEDRCRQHCRGFLLPQMERQQPIKIFWSFNWLRGEN